MKLLSNILFVCILFMSCRISSSQLIGKYRSNCSLYDAIPSLILNLKNDSSFSYKLALINEPITGKWLIKKDTIILDSKYFTEAYIQGLVEAQRTKVIASNDSFLVNYFTTERIRKMMPGFKYTYYPEKDIYLIRKKKLFAIDTSGVRVHCWLSKQNR